MIDAPLLDARDHPAAPRAWVDLRRRVASASVLAPMALGCLWAGGVPWAGLVALGVAGVALEWARLCGRGPLALAGLLLPAAVLAGLAASIVARPGLGLVLLAGGTVIVWIAGHADARVAGGVRGDSGLLAAGVPAAGLAGIALVWLRADPAVGRANLLLLILIVWASDIGAYLVGRLLGGPKLAPRLSPAKTWAGAAGGLVLASIAGLVVARLSSDGLAGDGLAAPARVALVAALLGIATQAGDLLESALKRHLGVKDSGRLIPGHGGLLDRLDGVLAAAPLAAVLALALGRGVLLWQ